MASCQVGAQIRPSQNGIDSAKAIAGTQANQRRSFWPSLSTSQPEARVPITPVAPSARA